MDILWIHSVETVVILRACLRPLDPQNLGLTKNQMGFGLQGKHNTMDLIHSPLFAWNKKGKYTNFTNV